jgi:hypothetical protein
LFIELINDYGLRLITQRSRQAPARLNIFVFRNPQRFAFKQFFICCLHCCFRIMADQECRVYCILTDQLLDFRPASIFGAFLYG